MDERDQQIAELTAQNSDQKQQIAKLQEEIAALKAVVEKLMQRLNQNSRNSSQPPSSDRFRDRPRKRSDRKKSSRKRGGQPGHQGKTRWMLPPEKVGRFENTYPEQCEDCFSILSRKSTGVYHAHQIVELDPVSPVVTEYRSHEVICPECGWATLEQFDESVTCSWFGPRLTAVIVMLTGAYHLSRRDVVKLIKDLFDIDISLGTVSNMEGRASDGLDDSVEEILKSALHADAKHTDGTGWFQNGYGMQLWTIATTMVTFYKILPDGSSASLQSMLTEKNGFLISDRAAAINFWPMKRRQICWSHLLRKFISFSERDGPAGTMGKELVEYADILFQYWREFQSGEITRTQLKKKMKPVRENVEALLEKAQKAGIREMSGSCANIMQHRKALWTYLDQAGVEPTNNHGERELRGFVLWRKKSFGSQSVRGNEFAERIMTVVHTARKRAVHLLDYLATVCKAVRGHEPSPSLMLA